MDGHDDDWVAVTDASGPRRFVGKIRGPKGAEVHQRWHVGGLWTPNKADRWEDYWGYVVHVL